MPDHLGRASRIALIMVRGSGDAAGLAHALDGEGLTVVGWSASVTAGSLDAGCAFEQRVPDTQGGSTHEGVRG